MPMHHEVNDLVKLNLVSKVIVFEFIVAALAKENNARFLLVPDLELALERLVFFSTNADLVKTDKLTYTSTNAILAEPKSSSVTSCQRGSISRHTENRLGEQNKTSQSPLLCPVKNYVFSSKFSSVSCSIG